MSSPADLRTKTVFGVSTLNSPRSLRRTHFAPATDSPAALMASTFTGCVLSFITDAQPEADPTTSTATSIRTNILSHSLNIGKFKIQKWVLKVQGTYSEPRS